mmetsp:Transcript_12013/g.51575  ORF Transcript_12013/g.51575 Transcript_12013/m.51575 type:complete len:313 (-) Transcript_12013:729-1667(-)
MPNKEVMPLSSSFVFTSFDSAKLDTCRGSLVGSEAPSEPEGASSDSSAFAAEGGVAGAISESESESESPSRREAPNVSAPFFRRRDVGDVFSRASRRARRRNAACARASLTEYGRTGATIASVLALESNTTPASSSSTGKGKRTSKNTCSAETLFSCFLFASRRVDTETVASVISTRSALALATVGSFTVTVTFAGHGEARRRLREKVSSSEESSSESSETSADATSSSSSSRVFAREIASSFASSFASSSPPVSSDTDMCGDVFRMRSATATSDAKSTYVGGGSDFSRSAFLADGASRPGTKARISFEPSP